MMIHLDIHFLHHPAGDRDIRKEELKKIKLKTSKKIRTRIILPIYSSQARLGWRSSSVQFTASSPQDTCSPLISSLSHYGLFSS